MDSDFIQSNFWLWYYKIHYLSHSFCFLHEPLKPRMWLMSLELYNMGTILSWRKCQCLHLLYLLVLSLKICCYFIYLRVFFFCCVFSCSLEPLASSSLTLIFFWSVLPVSFLMCLGYWSCNCEVLCLFTKHVSSNIDFVVCWLFYHDDFLTLFCWVSIHQGMFVTSAGVGRAPEQGTWGITHDSLPIVSVHNSGPWDHHCSP